MTDMKEFDDEEIFDEEADSAEDSVEESGSDDAPLNCIENGLKWLRGQKVIAGTLCRGKLANRIRRLAAAHPDDVKILAENADGSIFFHMPLSYLHIYSPKKRKLTEEQKKAAAEGLMKARGLKKD